MNYLITYWDSESEEYVTEEFYAHCNEYLGKRISEISFSIMSITIEG